MIPQSELDAAKDDFGWDSTFEGTNTVWAGTALPQGESTDGLFITSDKTNNPGAAEPPIWHASGCVWEATAVRSAWRELHLWSAADRTLIFPVAPELITQWNGLTASQQNQVRTLHSHSSASMVDCYLPTLTPEDDCDFWLAHPAVYAWALQMKFETTDGGTLETSWETLHSGVSYLGRFVDYADYRITY